MNMRLPALLLVTSLVAGCSTAQMRLPDGFAAAPERYDVSGHNPRRANADLRFGPYAVRAVRDGSTFSWSVPVAALDVSRAWQPYAFAIDAAGAPRVEAQCQARAWTLGHGGDQRTTLDLTALAGPYLSCAMRQAGAPPFALTLARTGRDMEGRLESASGPYRVRALHGVAGSRIAAYTPTGYAIEDGDRVVAAVDVLNAGQVYFDPDAGTADRPLLAAAMAALLLLDSELGD